MYKEKEEKAGYAKVEGPNLHHIITKTKVILGRELKHKEDSQISSDEEVVSLGSNLKISRRHLLLYFDYLHNQKAQFVLNNRTSNKDLQSEVRHKVYIFLCYRASSKAKKFC